MNNLKSLNIQTPVDKSANAHAYSQEIVQTKQSDFHLESLVTTNTQSVPEYNLKISKHTHILINKKI